MRPIVQVTKHPDPILVEDGGNWCHNPREDLRRGRETEAEDPELEGLPVQHEAKENDASRDELGPEDTRLVGPRRSSSRLGGWSSGLTEGSPCGSVMR